ncbi:MAG: PAS domain S-box protein [Spirochaetales bacterium]|nr:PAS domain S-box protein [Spirochaetales bacterium]
MGEEKDSYLFNIKSKIPFFILFISLCVLFYFIAFNNPLLLHTIAELFSIVIAFGLFVIAWNSKQYNMSEFLLFLGISYFFIASIDLVHTLSYTGMNIFTGYDTNLPTQLWIAARYLQSLSLLISFIFLKRKVKTGPVFFGFFVVTSLLIGLIFFRMFPDCYIEGSGLTLFKKISEYIISVFILISLFLFIKNRSYFDNKVYYLVLASLVATILSELSFTFYISVFGFFNFLGHMFKVAAFYFIYKAIIETSLRSPYKSLFKELKDKSENLKKSEKQYRTLFEYAPIGICIMTMDSTILMANAKLCAFLKSPYNGLTDKKMIDFSIKPHNFTLFLESLQTIGFIEDFEIQLRRMDNTSFFASLNSITIMFNNAKHLLLMIQDISQQKSYEQALIEKEDTLVKANDFLKDLNERKNKLLGMAAHDLRNPISVIQMYSQFLLKGIKVKMDNTEYHFLKTISRTSKFMLQLIDEVLDISKIEAGELQLHIEEYDYISILEEIIELNKVFAEQKQIDLKFLFTTKPYIFPFDRNKIEQVLNNLINNAIKYSYPKTKILIEAKEIDKMMETSVIDQGQGIPKDELQKLFLAFERTSVKPTGGEESTGLGLAIAKKIVEGHHGKIGVKSEPGIGSTFYFCIPINRE